MLIAVQSIVLVAVVIGAVLVTVMFAIVVRVRIAFVLVFMFIRHFGSLASSGLSSVKLAQKRRLLQGMTPALANFTRQLRALLVK